MGYAGKDRRIHRVFVTRNTEYHVRRDQCVGVRDRRTGEWLRAHLALRSQVSGALRFNREGGVMPNVGQPKIGDSLFFQASGRDLVTSAILSVERPTHEIVNTYEG
jgi:hypothetical protein